MSERSIFIAALEKGDPAERAAYLDQACAGDQALRKRLDRLLDAVARTGGILDRAPEPLMTGLYQPVTEGPGTRIGPYKLLQQIGEGGFGIVYMAEQMEPVRRKVALKIIKPGMDTKEVNARFESERQALALMDHPNIAKVLDAGATPPSPPLRKGGAWGGGRPYFVMELVKGVPITDYCDQNNLSTEGRLALFVTVSHAVQHAHQKGIIHRDLKPSNILVTLHDGIPVPKVIDFGVAKATSQHLTEKTLFTSFGQMIGTPAYMSPEQAEMSGLDIDTRSDIYSLGVLLYELLTGSTPFESKRLRDAGYAEMQRIIREETPPKPSKRLTSLGDTATVVSSHRSTDPKRLAALLTGDLDWIVMKSLEKDRNRRYDTPNSFAADVERFLRREAILARPPSKMYQLRKFAERNRAAVLTGSLVAATLLAAAAISAWLAVRATIAERQARGERDRAVTAEEEARNAEAKAVAEKHRADEQSEVAKAVNEFLQKDLLGQVSLIQQARSGIQLDSDIKVRTLLDRAASRIEGKFDRQPVVEAEIRETLASTYNELGEWAEAERNSRRAHELLAHILGPEHPNTIQIAVEMAWHIFWQGRENEARKLSEAMLQLRRRVLGDEHPATLSSITQLNGMLHDYPGALETRRTLLQEQLDVRARLLGLKHPATLSSKVDLAIVFQGEGRNEEAGELLKQALPLRRVTLGLRADGSLPWERYSLAEALENQGWLAEALEVQEETLQLWRGIVGPSSDATLGAMNNLARFLATAEDRRFRNPHRAIELAKEIVARLPKVRISWNTLGAAHLCAGDWKSAIAALEKSIELGNGGDSNDWFFLAMAHWQLGKKDEGNEWYDKAVKWMDKNQPKNPELLRFRKEAATLLGVKESGPPKGK
jgi:eukaryotic-like serine/threonine-protein kinase